MKGDYEEKAMVLARKNKANSKPILPFSVLRSAARLRKRLFEKTKPISGKGKSKKAKGKMRVSPEFLRRGYLKKRTQFLRGGNELKYLYERGL